MSELYEGGVARTTTPFLVTGAGRCGTHFVAEVLNALGIPTGHESVFGYDEASAGDWRGHRGDCSWPGAAYAHRLPVGSPVVHLVRDPLAMVRSRMGDNNLAATSRPRTVVSFVERHQRSIFDGAVDDAGRALLFVARWNRMVESISVALPQLPFRRVRIEDISASPDSFAETVLFLTGDGVDLEQCATALDRVDRSIGSRGRRAPFEWSDVRAHPNGDALVELASDYGYGT